MQNFSVEGGPPNVWGSAFRGSRQNFTITQGPEIWGNFPKLALKVFKNEKVWRKYQKKAKLSLKIFVFCARCWENEKYYTNML